MHFCFSLLQYHLTVVQTSCPSDFRLIPPQRALPACHFRAQMRRRLFCIPNGKPHPATRQHNQLLLLKSVTLSVSSTPQAARARNRTRRMQHMSLCAKRRRKLEWNLKLFHAPETHIFRQCELTGRCLASSR